MILVPRPVITEDFEMIDGVGRVVRVDNRPGREGMGVIFQELTQDSRRVVEEVTGLPPDLPDN